LGADLIPNEQRARLPPWWGLCSDSCESLTPYRWRQSSRRSPVATPCLVPSRGRISKFAPVIISCAPECSGAFDAALMAASAQTPEGSSCKVAFALTWIDDATFTSCVALERSPYDGLRAELLSLAPACGAPRRPLVALARSVSVRASMAAVHELLTATRTRTAALVARGSPRSRR
jgi:hypothetical protein